MDGNVDDHPYISYRNTTGLFFGFLIYLLIWHNYFISSIDFTVQSFQDYVVSSLERLHQKVDLQGEIIANLVKVSNSRQPAKSSITKPKYGFPLQNMAELDILEAKLGSDEFYKDFIISFS